VPEVILPAFVASVVADVANPVIKLVGIEPALNVPTPVIPVYEPDKRPEGKVPEEILAALVVSVVADVANPVILVDANVPVTCVDAILGVALAA
jgi:hypothetical protein